MFGIPAAKLKEDGEKLNEDGEKMRVLGLPHATCAPPPGVEPSQLHAAENPLTPSASVKELDGAGGELFPRIQLWIWKAFSSGTACPFGGCLLRFSAWPTKE